MKILISLILCLLFLTQPTHCLQWAKNFFVKKASSEAADRLRIPAQQAKNNFWHALQDGATDEAQNIINGAIDAFEHAVPGTKIEMIFIIQTNNNTQTNTTHVGPVDQHIHAYKHYLHKGTEQINQGFTSLSEYIAQNKKSLIGISCLGAYGIVQFILFSIKQKINLNACWSLYAIEEDEEQYTSKLLNDIQHAYCNVSNPADFITPLICFMEDIEEEKQYLEKYAKIIHFLEIFHLNRLFLYDENIYKNAPARMQKIEILKTTFMSWLAEFKVSQVQNNSQQLLLGIHKK